MWKFHQKMHASLKNIFIRVGIYPREGTQTYTACQVIQIYIYSLLNWIGPKIYKGYHLNTHFFCPDTLESQVRWLLSTPEKFCPFAESIIGWPFWIDLTFILFVKKTTFHHRALKQSWSYIFKRWFVQAEHLEMV